MDVSLCTPAVPEQADGNAECAGNHGVQTDLWLYLETFGFGTLDHPVGSDTECEETEEHAHADTDIGETDYARTEVILTFENFSNGREQKVEVAVDDCYV